MVNPLILAAGKAAMKEQRQAKSLATSRKRVSSPMPKLHRGRDFIDPKAKGRPEKPELKPGVDFEEKPLRKIQEELKPGVDNSEVSDKEKKELVKVVRQITKSSKKKTNARKRIRHAKGQAPNRRIVRDERGRFKVEDEPSPRMQAFLREEAKEEKIEKAEEKATVEETKAENKLRKIIETDFRPRRRRKDVVNPFIHPDNVKPKNLMTREDFQKWLASQNTKKKGEESQDSPKKKAKEKKEESSLIDKLVTMFFGAIAVAGFVESIVKTIARGVLNSIIDGINPLLKKIGLGEIPHITPINNPSYHGIGAGTPSTSGGAPAISRDVNVPPPPGQTPSVSGPLPQLPPIAPNATPDAYKPAMRAAGQQYNIDPARLDRTARAESNYNPDIISGKKTSPAGALGLMQFMPGTARDLGINPLNPNQAIFGAAKYLSQLDKMFHGNEALSHMAYNWGPGNVQNWVANGANPSAVPMETASYLAKVVPGANVQNAVNWNKNGASPQISDQTQNSQSVPGQQTPQTTPGMLPTQSSGQNVTIGSSVPPPPEARTGEQLSNSFSAPVNGPVTSGFGPRKSPGGIGSKNHEGIDFGVPVGTPVRAAGGGQVVGHGPIPGYGLYVDIRHNNGLVTRYGHLSSTNVREGQLLKQGEVLGLSGNSGISTGPHLHFEVRRNGRPINPTQVLSGNLGPISNQNEKQVNNLPMQSPGGVSVQQGQPNPYLYSPDTRAGNTNDPYNQPQFNLLGGLSLNMNQNFQMLASALIKGFGGLSGQMTRLQGIPSIGRMAIRDPKISMLDTPSSVFNQRSNIN